MKSYAQQPFQIRKTECEKVMQKVNNKVPVIIEPLDKRQPIMNNGRVKYLFQEDMTMQMLLIAVRKRLADLNEAESLFLILYIYKEDNTIETAVATMTQNLSMIYERFKSHDGFLYIKYTRDNAFGL